MTTDRQVNWLREGDIWSETEDSELRTRLLENGVIGPGQGGLRVRFVGAIVFRGRTWASLPKIRTSTTDENVHRHALRAMRRYRQWTPTHHEPSPYLNESPDKGPVSTLAATDWLIRDFAAHGLLRRMEITHEANGSGQINWRRTVETTDIVMSRGRPVYLETITRRSEADNRNFATRLHCYLLERLSRLYAPLLDLEAIVLDHEPVERLEALPSVEECKARLANEQRMTYSQRGIDLLAMMMATIEALEIETELGLSLFGTSSFYHIWEVACGRVFGNEVEKWKPFIPKPRWTSADGQHAESDTFIPDLVTPLDHHDLLIGDAKYYRPKMPPNLQDVPSVNDVAKQIWYKQCLQDEATRRSFTAIHNVFLFPRDVEKISLLGHVKMPPGVERVDAVAVPFLDALAIYSGDKRHDPQESREHLSLVMPKPPTAV